LAQAFLEGHNPRTFEAYRRDLEDFQRFVRAGEVETAVQLLIGRGHGEANALALAYRAHLIDCGLKAATVNRRLGALRSVVAFARTIGEIPWSLDVPNLKAQA
jgi:integrase/recombinase XerC